MTGGQGTGRNVEWIRRLLASLGKNKAERGGEERGQFVAKLKKIKKKRVIG